MEQAILREHLTGCTEACMAKVECGAYGRGTGRERLERSKYFQGLKMLS